MTKVSAKEKRQHQTAFSMQVTLYVVNMCVCAHVLPLSMCVCGVFVCGEGWVIFLKTHHHRVLSDSGSLTGSFRTASVFIHHFY